MIFFVSGLGLPPRQALGLAFGNEQLNSTSGGYLSHNLHGSHPYCGSFLHVVSAGSTQVGLPMRQVVPSQNSIRPVYMPSINPMVPARFSIGMFQRWTDNSEIRQFSKPGSRLYPQQGANQLWGTTHITILESAAPRKTAIKAAWSQTQRPWDCCSV